MEKVVRPTNFFWAYRNPLLPPLAAITSVQLHRCISPYGFLVQESEKGPRSEYLGPELLPALPEALISYKTISKIVKKKY